MNWEIKQRSLGLVQEQQFIFSQRWIWNPDEFYDSMILFFHQLKNGRWKTAFPCYDRQHLGSPSEGWKVQSPVFISEMAVTGGHKRTRPLPLASPSLHGCWREKEDEEKIRREKGKRQGKYVLAICPFKARIWSLILEWTDNRQSDSDKMSSLDFYLKGRVPFCL